MKIIIGLGNPGEKYDNTRHNVGFLALDYLKEKYATDSKWEDKSKLKAKICKINYKSNQIILVKPQTFMNLSGQAASQVLNFYKLSPKDCTVIFDDIDIELGKTKLKEKGSAGTHNGMKSIISLLKTNEIPRIKIGIENRSEKEKQIDLSSYVLGKFKNKEIKTIENCFDKMEEKLDQTLKIT